ncbi:MAG: CAAX prenyl protease-related protein [Geobacter sp.]|nr:CAAX prenyl protease-related protein [Geobacter sp.]
MNSLSLPRVAPFILFMAFIGLEEAARFLVGKGILSLPLQQLTFLYPIKAVAVAALLIRFRKQYQELEVKHLFIPLHLVISITCGTAVFALWILMDFSINPLGASQGFNPLVFEHRTTQILMISTRLAGAVLIVPIMEELFWRSFFIRYIIATDFSKVPIGQATWPSFLVTTLLFGLEHNLFFAGVMAGIAYNLLLYYTRSITLCILAHALTNLLLGIYVLATQQWRFW